MKLSSTQSDMAYMFAAMQCDGPDSMHILEQDNSTVVSAHTTSMQAGHTASPSKDAAGDHCRLAPVAAPMEAEPLSAGLVGAEADAP